jgi:hypothetical protein
MQSERVGVRPVSYTGSEITAMLGQWALTDHPVILIVDYNKLEIAKLEDIEEGDVLAGIPRRWTTVYEVPCVLRFSQPATLNVDDQVLASLSQEVSGGMPRQAIRSCSEH